MVTVFPLSESRSAALLRLRWVLWLSVVIPALGCLAVAAYLYRQEFADGSAVVQASAAFNAVEFAGEKFTGRMFIYAFDAEAVSNGSLHAVGTLRAWHETSLAAAKTGTVQLDRDPVTWQRLTSDLWLPANTDFLLIHLMIPAKKGTSLERGFAGHYIDDVRLTLSHSPLPSK